MIGAASGPTSASLLEDTASLRALLLATVAERDVAWAERDAATAERDAELAQNERLRHLLLKR